MDPRLGDKGRAKRSHSLRAAGEHTSSGCSGMGERKKTSTEAGQLADDYIHARMQNTEEASSQANQKFADRPTQRRFYQRSVTRQEIAGQWLNQWNRRKARRTQARNWRSQRETSRTLSVSTTTRSPSSNHPHRAMFCMERRSHRPIQSEKHQSVEKLNRDP